MLGTGDLNAIGNAAPNDLTGNSGNNYLDGMAGPDTMRGGAGNDYYVVDNPGDHVIENPGEGYDTIYSSMDCTLSVNVEALILTAQPSRPSTSRCSRP